MRRTRNSSVGLAYLSPQNKSLAQSFRYMRNKPTIIAFKTPSMEQAEQPQVEANGGSFEASVNAAEQGRLSRTESAAGDKLQLTRLSLAEVEQRPLEVTPRTVTYHYQFDCNPWLLFPTKDNHNNTHNNNNTGTTGSRKSRLRRPTFLRTLSTSITNRGTGAGGTGGGGSGSSTTNSGSKVTLDAGVMEVRPEHTHTHPNKHRHTL